jgi:hypothetical protein
MESTLANRKALFWTINIGIAIGYLYFVLFLLGITHDYTLNFQHIHIRWIYLDIFLITLGIFIFVSIFKKYVERANSITRTITILTGTYLISLFFTLYKKLVSFLIVETVLDPDSYIRMMIYNFRFSFMFIAISGMFLFEFYLELFAQSNQIVKGRNKIIIISLIVALAQFYPFDSTNFIVKTILSVLVLLQSVIIYFPVAIQSAKMIRRAKDPNEFNLNVTESRQMYFGFLFLFFIAMSFICIWICNVSAIIYDMVTETSYGPFYLAQNIFVIVLLVNIYFGFVMPKWFKEKVLKMI